MSATARAPRPDDDAPRPGAARAPRTSRPAPRGGAPRTPAPRGTPARPAPAAGSPGSRGAEATGGKAPDAKAPVPVTGRAHSAPVRAGALRARSPRPVPRPAPAPAAAAEPRRRAGTGSARRAPFVLLVVGLLVGTTLALLFLNTAIAVNSLKATQLRAENTERTQTLDRLEEQVVTAGTPAAMAAAAAAAGLVPVGTAAYLVLGPDGSAVLRGTPVPAEAPAAPGDGDEG